MIALVQSVAGVRELRREVDWRLVLRATAARYIATIAGACLLRHLAVLPAADIRMTVGVVLATVVGAQLAIRPRPRDRLPAAWGPLAFLASGLLAGLVGMGGPPLVLWAMAHTWSSERTRAFLFSMFLLALPFQLLVLALLFPADTAAGAAVGALSAPLVVLGAFLGLRIGARIPKPVLRGIAYGLLLAIAASAMLPRLAHYAAGWFGSR